MTDSELQYVILKWFYERRDGEMACPRPADLGVDASEQAVLRVCSNLGDLMLLDWKQRRRNDGLIAMGIGRITVNGISAIETPPSPAPAPSVRHQTVNISHSQGFAVGDGNTVSVTLDSINTLIDQGQGTPQQKAEAKGLLARIAEHPLVAAAVGAALPGFFG